MSMLRAILDGIRRYFGRRTARKLLAQNLPKGLSESPRLRALPERRLPEDAPQREFWTLQLGRKPAARLFRIVAVPRPVKTLDVLRALPRRSLDRPLRLPKTLDLPAPLETVVADLGTARPRSLRLDADLRLPCEVDPLQLAADKPPTRTRRVRPRTPLGRAPIDFRFRPAHFRLDENSLRPANEGIVPLEMRDTTYRWVRPTFRSRWLELHWMAQERIKFLGPLQHEWFLMWWDQFAARRPGAKDPHDYVLPVELGWALEAVKEQMLIRRDVKKDELPPEPEKFSAMDLGQPIGAHERTTPSELIPKTEWFAATTLELPTPTQPRLSREAYLQWRTLVDALEER